MTKAELRQLYLRKRRELSLSQVAAASMKIADRFFTELDLGKVVHLSTFVRIPKFNEVDTSAIYYRLWRDKPWIKTFAPRTNMRTGEMENLTLFPDTPFTENTWGLREPSAGDVIEPALLDLVVVPLLCIDPLGHRVGYGKGVYDRFLARCRDDCLKVGVNYFPPLEQAIDAAEHDMPIDACITPDNIYRF